MRMVKLTNKGKPLAIHNGLKVYKPLKAKTPLKAHTQLKKTSAKTAKRNKNWREIVMARAAYLIQKYGRLVCEYSGETILALCSVPDTLEDGWGHHIDGNRNHQKDNCFIVKYKYHRVITDQNIKVEPEMFAKRLKG